MDTTVSVPRGLRLPDAPAITSRRSLIILGCLGAIAAVGGAALLGTSDHLAYPVGFAVFYADLVAGTIAVGLYWLARRPTSRFGPLLIGFGFLYTGVALQGADDPVLHSLGVLFDVPLLLFGTYVLLLFPLVRLRGLERALLVPAALAVGVGFAPWFLLSNTVQDWAPLGRCGSSCPANGFQIADLPGVAAAFGRLERGLLAVFALAILVGLLYRSRTAKRPERRARGPVLAWVVVYAVTLAAVAIERASGADGRSFNSADLALTLTRATLSYSFLAAVLLAAVFAGAALRQMVTGLGARPSSAELRGVVSEALDDPELDLGFWLAGAGELVDSEGRPVSRPPPESDRALTEFAAAGNRIAILHHVALNEDPELLRAAGSAILFSLESGRLQAELSRTNAELRASRKRVVSAADAERRKIERDLHDSSQQQLIALRMRLGLARELADEGDPELPQLLTEVGEELDEALAELRDVAHGIYPPLLVEGGLGDALAQAARRSAIRVEFDRDGIQRYPEPVEAAVYFSCIEALQNAAKHGGNDAAVRMKVSEAEGLLRFEVRDDGAGFDPARSPRGAGLRNMADRVGAVGGTVKITSMPGRGTRVAGRVSIRG
jgi:signal transduction histidine kinase